LAAFVFPSFSPTCCTKNESLTVPVYGTLAISSIVLAAFLFPRGTAAVILLDVCGLFVYFAKVTFLI
jgi:hypothetical protein